ncbi:hypothetical protein WBP06_18740 [Novosphingobium sp. BL-8H]|uniref:hypothetical protein n=1 Tax=Novosphingobium sp. BL-8H TaxID=3127640 RepID=UPI003757E54B
MIETTKFPRFYRVAPHTSCGDAKGWDRGGERAHPVGIAGKPLIRAATNVGLAGNSNWHRRKA